MKRFMGILMILLLLAGCGQAESPAVVPEDPPQVTEPAPEDVAAEPEPEETAVPEPQEETEPVQEPTPAPEPDPAPEPAPEPEPAPAQEEAQSPAPPAELEPEPDSEPEPGLNRAAAAAAEVMSAITEHSEFGVQVWRDHGARTELVIRKGVNDWNVEHVKYCLPSFEWTEASYEEAFVQAQTGEAGATLLFWDEACGLKLTCFRNTDLVILQDPTKITYLRAADPDGNETLYDLMSIVAEDAVSHEIRYVTVDGSLSPQEAAGRIAEKIAENYRSVPDWVVWKPVSVKAERAQVYDIYRGTPEEFCFNLGLAVKVTDPMAPEAGYWQAGSGLEAPDENGFHGWGREVLVRKNDEGNWSVLGLGTGGYSVSPEWPAEKPWAAWLVELFCLTEGDTHTWFAPIQILSLTPDQMETLPGLLDQLTEEESRELCSVLGELLRRDDLQNYYTVETLKPLLGTYGALLDA